MTDEEQKFWNLLCNQGTLEDERTALLYRSYGRLVYDALEDARKAEDRVRGIAKRYGDHPAFRAYIISMGLQGLLEEFLARPEAKRS